MTRDEAKKILLLHCPGREQPEDLETIAALEQARTDPELQNWFTEHCAFQEAMRSKFQALPVPADLGKRIAEGTVLAGPRSWWTVRGLPAAAAVLIFAGLLAFWAHPRRQDRFEDFRERMVGSIVREYRMEITTRDMTEVRSFLRKNGAPANYSITPGLARIATAGAGHLGWHGHPVSMVCFQADPNEMVFLFVMDGASVRGAPPRAPVVSQISRFATAAWSVDDQIYLLAAADGGRLRNYLR